MLLVGLIDRFSKPFSRRAHIIIACGFLVLAFFVSWRTEYLKTTPGLRLTIDVASTARELDGSVINFLTVSISNLGAPSVADQWMLEVVDNGQSTKFLPQIIHQSEPMYVGDATGKHTAEYNQKDALYEKTISNPIPTGAKLTGFLIFNRGKIAQADADRKGILLRVSCKDVFGNSIHGDLITTGYGSIGDKLPYFPGTTEPVTKDNP